MKISHSSERGKCLACGANLGLFRKLCNRQFCCRDHEQKYQAEIRALSLARLRGVGLGLDATHARDVNA